MVNISSVKPNDGQQQSFNRELKAYVELSGGYILKSFAYAMTDTGAGKSCMLLMEYMDQGSLSAVLEKAEKMSLYQKLNMARQIASGMQKIHNHGMIHRDIRPDNILVNEYFTAKIGDMGIVRSVHEKSETQKIGCLAFMPPEFYANDFNEKLDVYTYALTLNQLFTELQHDFSMQPTPAIAFRTKSPLFFDLIERCMQIHPDDRPTAVELEATMVLFTQAFFVLAVKEQPAFLRLPTKEKDAIFMKFYEKFRQPAIDYLQRRFPPVLFGMAPPQPRKPRDEEPVECPIQ